MQGAGFSRGDIVSEMNHIHGAHKAVALATTLAIFELSRPVNEPWRCAVVAEFVAVLAGREHPERSDLAQLPVLASVMDETLRLHVVSFGTMRCTGIAEQHEGVCLPKGSEMQLWLHALHRHPEHFPQPNVFDPHRFLGQRSTPVVPIPPARSGQTTAETGTYYPFLDGQRRCAGIHLAKLQFSVMLHALLVNWDVRCTVDTLKKLPDMFVGLEGAITYTMRSVASTK
jgi:cytochrome P450